MTLCAFMQSMHAGTALLQLVLLVGRQLQEHACCNMRDVSLLIENTAWGTH